jgi:methylmalonyl-CoA mutase cobalamin-binding subunit
VAALAVTAAGRQSLVLGPQSPVEEIAEAAISVNAAAVGVSISPFSVAEESRAYVENLRERLPSGMSLWIGGSGAENLVDLPTGVEVLDSLDSLDRALRRLVD